MLNRTILVGRLVRDPELRYTPSGVATATFTLAVNRPFKAKNGEQEVDFINVVVWRQAAENAANFLKKGSLCGVDGRITTRNFEGKDGKKVYVTEVTAESVQFLDSKGSGQADKQDKPTKKAPRYTADPDDPFAGSGQLDITDDSLPF